VQEFILHHYTTSWVSIWIGECFLCGDAIVFREDKAKAEKELKDHIMQVHYMEEESKI
jgi:hypothetical protein